jgi:glycosyltransferase involved in cell wall biosynthesis
MSTTPLITIVLPTHIKGPYLDETLASVLNQTCADWELILVDDGSSQHDELAAAVDIDPRMTIVRHPHGGIARSRNVGLSEAQGEFVVFLDHDDLWYPHHLHALHASLAPADAAVAAYGGHRTIDGTGNAITTYSPQGDITPRSVLEGSARPGLHTMLIRRSTLNRIGGFYPPLEPGDDVDLINRLAEEGDIVFVPGPTCLYRWHDTNTSRNTRAVASAGLSVVAVHRSYAERQGNTMFAKALKVNYKASRNFWAFALLRDAARNRSPAQILWTAKTYPAGTVHALLGAPIRIVRKIFRRSG